MDKIKSALIIAGSDSIAGAGIQADIKTMYSLNVFACTVITAVTCQNTVQVTDMSVMDKKIVEKQLQAVLEDTDVQIVKSGMLANSAIIDSVYRYICKYNLCLVLDPVMITTSNFRLLDQKAEESLRRLISKAYLITPNLMEAATLTDMPIVSEKDIYLAGKKLLKLGTKNVLIKSAGLHSGSDIITNYLFTEQGGIHKFENLNRKDKEFHGTGCILASAITAYLFLGNNMIQSIDKAVKYVAQLVENPLGKGAGSYILQ